MAKHIWTIVCRKAVVDAANNLSIIDVTEEVGVFPEPPITPEPPAPPGAKIMLPIEITIVSYWTRENRHKEETAKQRLQLLGPDGKLIGGGEGLIDLTKVANARVMAQLPGIPYSGFGVYLFEISRPEKTEWTPVASIPILLKLGPDPSVRN